MCGVVEGHQFHAHQGSGRHDYGRNNREQTAITRPEGAAKECEQRSDPHAKNRVLGLGKKQQSHTDHQSNGVGLSAPGGGTKK